MVYIYYSTRWKKVRSNAYFPEWKPAFNLLSILYHIRFEMDATEDQVLLKQYISFSNRNREKHVFMYTKQTTPLPISLNGSFIHPVCPSFEISGLNVSS